MKKTTKGKTMISVLAETNDYKYNLLKTVEELSELSEVLMKKVLKVDKKQPTDEEIIDEIGDVYIRIKVLSKLFNEKAVSKRIRLKLRKFREYLNEGKYKGGI